MLTDQRHQIILAELAASGRVIAGDLAQRFGVSEDTIRRDLRDLAKGGDCRRVYGGAVAPAPYAGPVAARTTHASAEKARLARAAVPLIRPGQTLFIDGGTTNIAIATAIPQGIPLTVATNALGVANALAGHVQVNLIMLGGVFDRDKGACHGGDTLQAIARLNADLFFLGTCGIDAARGITAFDPAEAEVKRAMALNSTDIAIAVTAEKLGTAAPFRVVGAETVAHLVVDGSVPQDTVAGFEAMGIRVLRG